MGQGGRDSSRLSPDPALPGFCQPGVLSLHGVVFAVFCKRPCAGSGIPDRWCFAHSRRGLIFHVAATMPAVRRPLMSPAMGSASVSTEVAAHPIEEKASAKVASRDEV